MSMIPYGHQNIDKSDIDAVLDVLTSDFLTQGPYVERFENALSEYVGAEYACAVSNGTAALHLACLSLGLGAGDWLWTVPISFVASANCARFCGANIDFVDIDGDTLNIDIDALEQKLNLAKKHGHLPKIIVVVHFSGFPCDMRAIRELSQEYNFYVIEDAAHALGAEYFDTKIGDCKYSDVTTFSFHPIKTITTGEGGMIMTNSESLVKKMKILRSHGITKNVDFEAPWIYQQIDLGFNYRLSDILAALGVSQLRRIEKFLKRREEISDKYTASLSGLNVKVPLIKDGYKSAWHLYVIQVEDEIKRRALYDRLKENNIYAQVHYMPIHLQPYYQELGFKGGDYPVAENYYKRALSLPIFYDLNDFDLARIIEVMLGELS